MKSICLGMMFLLFSVNCANAHSLLLHVLDNEDGTITVQGKFDTGALATGAVVRLETLGSSEIIFEKRMPMESELTVDIPNQPYRIILDGGPGHQAVKEGMAPPQGFTVKAGKAGTARAPKAAPKHQQLNLPFVICTGAAFCMLGLTLFFCKRNTDRLINELKNSP